MYVELTMIHDGCTEGPEERSVLINIACIHAIVPLFESDGQGEGCNIAMPGEGGPLHVKESYEQVSRALEQTMYKMNDSFWFTRTQYPSLCNQ